MVTNNLGRHVCFLGRPRYIIEISVHDRIDLYSYLFILVMTNDLLIINCVEAYSIQMRIKKTCQIERKHENTYFNVIYLLHS